MTKIFLTLTCLAITIANSYSQNTWKLKTEEDGIKVYTRQAENSGFKAVKVTCDMPVNASQLVAAIMDIKNNASWAYHTKLSTLLKQVSPSELYYYSEVQIPWPAQNRDFITHITVKQNPQTKVVNIDAPCVGDYMPPKKNLVRVTNSSGKWVITSAGKDKINVEYYLTVDPGGDSPAWLINMFIVDGPLQTIKKLREQVQKPAYQHVELPYIIN